MLCWARERLRAVRGGLCHLRQAVRSDSIANFRTLGRLAGVTAGVASIAVALFVPVVVSPLAIAWRPHAKVGRRALTPIAYVTTMVATEVKRKVYPYSLVPGGAANVREAKIAMTEPANRVNYADMDLAQLKQVKLTANLSGYLSYRWGDKIYWTKKALTLRAGETIFTDGTHIVRGRCLNCYSARPMLPVRPNEPSAKVLDTPVEMPLTVYAFPKLPLIAPELPVPPEELTPTVPVLAPVLSTVGKTAGGGFWFPILPIIPPIHRHPKQPSPPGSPQPPGSPPVIPPVAIVPEPRYGWLLLSGFLALLIYHKRRRAA